MRLEQNAITAVVSKSRKISATAWKTVSFQRKKMCHSFAGDALGFHTVHSYKKFSAVSRQPWNYFRDKCSSNFGPDLSSAVLNSAEEFNALQEGNMGLTDIRTFYIYGSTNRPHNSLINYNDYKPNKSGNRFLNSSSS